MHLIWLAIGIMGLLSGLYLKFFVFSKTSNRPVKESANIIEFPLHQSRHIRIHNRFRRFWNHKKQKQKTIVHIHTPENLVFFSGSIKKHNRNRKQFFIR